MPAFTPDQSFITGQDNPTDDIFQLRRGSNNQEKLGQGFTPTVTAPVTRVDIHLKKQGTPTGNIWAEIWSDDGGGASSLPNAQLGSNSANVDVSTVSTSFDYVTFTFSNPIKIQNGIRYWIVLNGDYTLSTTNAVQWGADTSSPGYAGGHAARFGNGAAVWEIRDYDALFKEYRDDTVEDDTAFFI